MKVYKYPAPEGAESWSVEMPMGAQVVHAGFQGTRLCLWALVDPEAPAVPRRFLIVGTGQEITDHHLAHVATWFEGPFVWHLFGELI
jgi:hypothetical protein